MSISIINNTIPVLTRGSVEKALLDGIGQRPENESWKIWMDEPQNRSAYIITIEGPNDFNWKREFFGIDEQTPIFIREKVRKATRSK